MLLNALFRRASPSLLAFTLLTAAANAQTISLTPNPLVVGGTGTVTYTNSSKPNETVIVTISGGVPPEIHEIKVKLNGSGVGSAQFTVPDWWTVHANGPGAVEASVPTVPGKS